jgi:hypothetical protein
MDSSPNKSWKQDAEVPMRSQGLAHITEAILSVIHLDVLSFGVPYGCRSDKIIGQTTLNSTVKKGVYSQKSNTIFASFLLISLTTCAFSMLLELNIQASGSHKSAL